MKVDRILGFLASWIDLETIGYAFSIAVFGAYIWSMIGDLFDLPGAPDILEPIRIAFWMWFSLSVLYLVGQAAGKRWNGVIVSLISLGGWWLTNEPVMANLDRTYAAGFLGLLHLEPATKLLIAGVFLIAFAHVVLAPFIWLRKRRATSTAV